MIKIKTNLFRKNELHQNNCSMINCIIKISLSEKFVTLFVRHPCDIYFVLRNNYFKTFLRL